jgi:hypothetical protein
MHRSHERNLACYKQRNLFPRDIVISIRSLNPECEIGIARGRIVITPFASSGAFNNRIAFFLKT